MGEPYPLEELLSVRRFREQAAARSVAHAQRKLVEARSNVERREQELQDWRRWREEETDRRYASLLGRPTKIEAIDAFHHGLAVLAAQELGKLSAVDEARKNVADCEKAVENARLAASAAARNTAKIQAHKSIWSEAAKKEAERLEDLEFEEFKPVKRLGAEAEDTTL